MELVLGLVVVVVKEFGTLMNGLRSVRLVLFGGPRRRRRLDCRVGWRAGRLGIHGIQRDKLGRYTLFVDVDAFIGDDGMSSRSAFELLLNLAIRVATSVVLAGSTRTLYGLLTVLTPVKAVVVIIDSH